LAKGKPKGSPERCARALAKALSTTLLRSGAPQRVAQRGLGYLSGGSADWQGLERWALDIRRLVKGLAPVDPRNRPH